MRIKMTAWLYPVTHEFLLESWDLDDRSGYIDEEIYHQFECALACVRKERKATENETIAKETNP